MSLPHVRLTEAADQLTEQLARLGTPARAALPTHQRLGHHSKEELPQPVWHLLPHKSKA